MPTRVLKALLGHDDKFFNLLAASAQEAENSVKLLTQFLKESSREGERVKPEFVLSRRKDKKITQEITAELCKTFVTPIEREDIEALSRSLYRIPKTVEKIVEHMCVYPRPVSQEGFLRQVALLEEAVASVSYMVGKLRSRNRMNEISEANDRLQHIEGEADKLMLELVRDLYAAERDSREVIYLHDMYDMFEKSVDRCRDAGNVALQIVLKYS